MVKTFLTLVFLCVGMTVSAKTLIHAGYLFNAENGTIEPQMSIVIVEDRVANVLEGYVNPEPDDIYALSYSIPFLSSDTLFIHTNAPDSISVENHDIDMDEIKVVPNPYVATNLMEEAFSNPNQNQERKIMFTHLPARCDIKIFTVSGVLVNTIEVNNSYDDGKAYWDLLSNEGLEVAAGIYIYHVQSKINEKYSLGKFAIVK